MQGEVNTDKEELRHVKVQCQYLPSIVRKVSEVDLSTKAYIHSFQIKVRQVLISHKTQIRKESTHLSLNRIRAKGFIISC